MELIEQLQGILPSPLVRYFCPIVLIACFLLMFGYWLYPRWRVVGGVYSFSLLSNLLVDRLFNYSETTSAAIAGILAPGLCCTLFVLAGAARTLHLPHALRLNFSPVRYFSRHPLLRLGHAIVIGCAGGVVGAVWGALLGFGLVLLFAIMALTPLSLLTIETPGGAFLRAAINSGIYGVGGVGVVLGGLAGLGYLNMQRVGDRLLVSLVIYSALLKMLLQKLWRSVQWLAGGSSLSRAGSSSSPTTRAARLHIKSQAANPIVEIVDQPQRFWLRRRAYRSLDWIGMGFNGLFSSFALTIATLATQQAIWQTAGWLPGGLLLLALLWTWYSLTRLCNTTQIAIDPFWLRRWDGPLFSFAPRLRIPTEQIASYKALATIPQTLRLSEPPGYHVCAILKNGRRIYLLSNLEKWEEAALIADRLVEHCTHSSLP